MSSATTRTLSMKFETGGGDLATVSISNAKGTVSAGEVMEAMETMISHQILACELTAAKSAQLVERTVTTLF